MTCKHCGKPIYSTGAIWLHRDGHLTQCTLPTYAEPAKPAAIRCALCTWQWLGDGEEREVGDRAVGRAFLRLGIVGPVDVLACVGGVVSHGKSP